MMDKEGSKCVEISGANDKRQIIAVFCGSLTSDFLLLQLIYKVKSPHCQTRFQFPSDWHVTYSPKHCMVGIGTVVQYITKIFVPYIKAQRDALGDSEQSALVIMDNFKDR